MKNIDIIECACHNSEHMLILHKFPEDNMISLEYHLTSFPFWERLKFGIKYIFGYKSKYGNFDETIITAENYSDFKQIINFFEKDHVNVMKISFNALVKFIKFNASEQKTIRYGQSVFNTAFDLFPEQVDLLRATKFDCFYKDEMVNEFFVELQRILNISE